MPLPIDERGELGDPSVTHVRDVLQRTDLRVIASWPETDPSSSWNPASRWRITPAIVAAVDASSDMEDLVVVDGPPGGGVHGADTIDAGRSS